MENKFAGAFIPKPYWDFELDDYVARDDAYYIVEEYISNLAKYADTGQGLIFVGEPGLGKTMLASIVLMEALIKDYSGYFTTLAKYSKGLLMQLDLKQAWQKMGDQEVYELWKAREIVLGKMHNEYKFLVIDDVGKEHLTKSNFAQDEFDYLLRTRFSRGLPTILTTNVKLKDWDAQYSRAMASFIHESCIVVECNGKDYRKQ